MARSREFKVLCMQNIKLPCIHLKGEDSKYYGFKSMTPFWFPWLEGGNSKYYGCEIYPLPQTF
jgi:hypothetical protein